MGNAYIVDACRTPRGIGKVGKGALAHLHPSYLGSTVLAAMAAQKPKAANGLKIPVSSAKSLARAEFLCQPGQSSGCAATTRSHLWFWTSGTPSQLAPQI